MDIKWKAQQKQKIDVQMQNMQQIHNQQRRYIEK